MQISNRIYKFYILLLLIFTYNINNLHSCTIAVLSGKITDNGKPYLFKNRDGSNGDFEVTLVDKNSALQCITNNCFKYIAVTKWKEDSENKFIYGGINEHNFAIGNAVISTYDMRDNLSNKNLYLQRIALESCKTINDFENLLNNWLKNNKNTAINSYYAVIDNNHAVIYKVLTVNNKLNITKYDADESPSGYYVFSSMLQRFSNNDHESKRMKKFEEIIDNNLNNNKFINFETLKAISRNVCDNLETIKSDLINIDPCINNENTMFSIIINNKDMYVNLNNPIAGIFLPTSIDYIPEALYYDDVNGFACSKQSELCSDGINKSSKSIVHSIYDKNINTLFIREKYLIVKNALNILNKNINTERELQSNYFNNLNYFINIQN